MFTEEREGRICVEQRLEESDLLLGMMQKKQEMHVLTNTLIGPLYA